MISRIEGLWTYRSCRNDPRLISGDPDKAAENIFGEGVFELRLDGDTLSGTLDMGGGYLLDLSGSTGVDAGFSIVGTGREGTPTAGWEYDYWGAPAYTWPNGLDQVPALVGSVIRAKPHGGAPAGYVASFVAVRQP